MERTVADLEAFEAEAAEFAGRLRPREGGAALVTLSGELGAGKTAFVKAVAKALGVTIDLTSPTFVLEKRYALTGPFAQLIHIDAYRLEGGSELTPLHFDETLKQADNLIMLEWPEKVQDALPRAEASVSIEVLADGTRKLTYG